LERLGTVERIQKAKGELVQALPADGVAILNGDDRLVSEMRDWTKARAFTYGLDAKHDLWADEIESFGLEGMAFDLHFGSDKVHVRVPLLGRHSVHTSLAAASVGVIEGLSWEDILGGLKDLSAQLRLIAMPGEKGTTLLDDTYNASPESSLAALNLLAELSGRKVAVLGDMLELGSVEEPGHRLVGARAAEIAQVVVAVGTRGRWIGESAQEAGLAQVHFAENNAEAIEILRQVALKGDMILIKGSRGVGMEEIVNALSRTGENGTTESNEWPGP
jgi:UDP-N-acetylmuramoyl-tripeptide--D-alanyl-D-alanine ligase